MTEQFLDIIFPDLNTDWGGLSRDKMNEIYHLSIAHNLFPLVYTQLKKAGPNKTASSVSEFLLEKKMGFLRVVTQALRHEILEKKLVKIFRENGSPALVFKGNILAKEIYNAANTRRSTDIDLLIKIEDVQKVDSLMKEEQFTALEEESSEFWIHRKHHLVYTCPQTNTVIEIHWNFCIPGFFKLSSDDIWSDVRHDSEGIPRLSPEMMLVSLLVHNSMHAFRDLRIFVDILWALHRYNHVIDWAVFSAQLKKTGLVKTTYISLVQIERIWGRRVEKIEAFNQLIRHIEALLWIKPSLACRYFNFELEHPTRYSHQRDQFFVRLTLDRPGTIIRSFVKSFIPLPAELQSFYNDYRLWHLPQNYIKFIRWRLSEWTH